MCTEPNSDRAPLPSQLVGKTDLLVTVAGDNVFATEIKNPVSWIGGAATTTSPTGPTHYQTSSWQAFID
ncbi:MAG: hypothetical protein ACRDSL_13460 [Pseudonocardiaceae bacterium]